MEPEYVFDLNAELSDAVRRDRLGEYQIKIRKLIIDGEALLQKYQEETDKLESFGWGSIKDYADLLDDSLCVWKQCALLYLEEALIKSNFSKMAIRVDYYSNAEDELDENVLTTEDCLWFEEGMKQVEDISANLIEGLLNTNSREQGIIEYLVSINSRVVILREDPVE